MIAVHFRSYLSSSTRAAWAALLCLSALLCRSADAAEVNPAVLRAEAERVAVVERASSYAVAVFANNGQGGGSGVVISRRWLRACPTST